ncbi:MAG: VCBS repeat-containing protein [Flavobacteriales bacterium]|nr:VCBS repeat-containing protein [Flavobacteriales bacterium]
MRTKRSPLVLATAMLSFFGAMAQPELHFDKNIAVTRQGNDLDLAWAGGLNYPQISRIDLDLDGAKDLVFFDRTDNRLITLINTPGGGTSTYTITRDFDEQWPFRELHDWALFRDYDCDGKEDIFSYSQAGFSVYRNTSTNDELSFELLKFRVNCEYVFTDGSSQTTNLFISSEDLPGFADIDGDGDMDVLTFAQLGSYVQYYKNQSMEEYGSCDSLDFVLTNACWGRFAESAATNDVTLDAACPFQIPNPEMGPEPAHEGSLEGSPEDRAHTGSTVTPIDLDGDGVKDLLLGDISYPNLVALYNGGTVDDSHMTSFEVGFPADDVPVHLPVFPAPFHLDVDDDGDGDLLVSPNSRSLAQNFKGVWYFQNTGSDAAPNFEFQEEDVFQSRMIEVGQGAYPILFDHNSDGRMDLIVANEGYFDPTGDYIGKLMLLENTGTLSEPAFEVITDDYMGLSTSGIGTAMYPAFADLDGDGDKDMYIGDLEGNMHLFVNVAAGPVAQFQLTQPNVTYGNGTVIDLGRQVTPHFVDFDNDGLQDLVVGEQNGNLNYLHNDGTASAPSWTLVTDSLGFARTTTPFGSGFSVPVFFSGPDGQRQLLVASETGTLWHYSSSDWSPTSHWTLEDESYLDLREGFRTGLAAHDFTGDGVADFVIGNFRGGVSFWRSDGTSSIARRSAEPVLFAYPNPTTGRVEIDLKGDVPVGSRIVVRNALGQMILDRSFRSGHVVVDLGEQADGIYSICCEGPGRRYAPVRVLLSRRSH